MIDIILDSNIIISEAFYPRRVRKVLIDKKCDSR